jgi:hypothetical protein
MSETDYSDFDIIPEYDPEENREIQREDLDLQEALQIKLAALRHRRVVGTLPPEVTRHQLRSAMLLTQVQVAQRLEVTQVRVSRIERHPNPRLGLLQAYVRALGGSLYLVARFEKVDYRLRLDIGRVSEVNSTYPQSPTP